MTVNYVLFVNLTKLALNKDAASISASLAYLKIDQLKSWLTQQLKITNDEEWKAHYSYLLMKINTLQSDPEKYKTETLFAPPPGQPIGMDEDFCEN
jgi:hypothetical protein